MYLSSILGNQYKILVFGCRKAWRVAEDSALSDLKHVIDRLHAVIFISFLYCFILMSNIYIFTVEIFNTLPFS